MMNLNPRVPVVYFSSICDVKHTISINDITEGEEIENTLMYEQED